MKTPQQVAEDLMAVCAEIDLKNMHKFGLSSARIRVTGMITAYIVYLEQAHPGELEKDIKELREMIDELEIRAKAERTT